MLMLVPIRDLRNAGILLLFVYLFFLVSRLLDAVNHAGSSSALLYGGDTHFALAI